MNIFATGRPVIIRLRKASIKKVLQVTLDEKDVTAANLALLSSLKTLIADACQQFEGIDAGAGGGQARLQTVLEECQCARELALDWRVQQALEAVNSKRVVEPAMALEQTRFMQFAKEMDKPRMSADEGDELAARAAHKFNRAVMYALKRGSWSTVTAHGSTSTVQIQGEGNRVIALARYSEIKEVFGGSMADCVAGWESLTVKSEEISDRGRAHDPCRLLDHRAGREQPQLWREGVFSFHVSQIPEKRRSPGNGFKC